MHFIKNNSKNQLIEMCSNVNCLKQTILIAQDVIHKYVSNECIKIVNNMKNNNGNNGNNGNDSNDQRDQKDNNDSDENDDNDEQMQSNQSQSQSQSQSQVPNTQSSQLQIEVPINFNKTMEYIRNNTKVTQDSFDLVEISKEIEKALIESWHDEEYSHQFLSFVFFFANH